MTRENSHHPLTQLDLKLNSKWHYGANCGFTVQNIIRMYCGCIRNDSMIPKKQNCAVIIDASYLTISSPYTGLPRLLRPC